MAETGKYRINQPIPYHKKRYEPGYEGASEKYGEVNEDGLEQFPNSDGQHK